MTLNTRQSTVSFIFSDIFENIYQKIFKEGHPKYNTLDIPFVIYQLFKSLGLEEYGTIKGLAEGNIKKLKDNLNINTVNELVSLNPDTIASIPGISAKKAKDWIEEGKKVLENSFSI